LTVNDGGGLEAIPPFGLGRVPRVHFGAGQLRTSAADVVAGHGHLVLLVTGRRSFQEDRRAELSGELARRGIEVVGEERVDGEPSPGLIDDAVARHAPARPEVVLAIGGGSVLDAGKAIAGLLLTGTSIRDHLEGVGPELPYPGPSVPLVAVPTTAGTGSEATRNAVVTERGPGGFKRSFRDERLVATDAIVDPDLLAGAPPALIAANGLDAITQLMESYVSLRAGPLTDALALAGLRGTRAALVTWFRDPGGPNAPAARSRMAFAALLSGICLAHAGLGVAHGLASPLGAFFPIPHGAACGAVLAAGTAANIRALEERAPTDPALARYAALGRLVAGLPDEVPDATAREALLAALRSLVRDLELPGLATFGVAETAIGQIVGESRGSSMRTNPILLTDDELAGVLHDSL
jgi:alcohol dehydrogenase class IV